MQEIYLVCFLVGLGFAVMSFLLGDLLGTHGGFDHASMDAGGDGSAWHFPILSPIVVAAFVTTFGGIGLILEKSVPQWSMAPQVGTAFGAGLLAAGLAGYTLGRLVRGLEGTSSPSESDLVGADAEVVVSIPKSGAGQIRYAAKGSYFTGIGRSEDGMDIRQGDTVKIVRVVGGTMFVRKFQN